jgi:transposase-like protein
MINREELEAFAKKAAKSIKTEKDLSDFCQQLAKITIETALNAELEHHLSYAKHEISNSENSRNGYSLKTVKTEDGRLEIGVPHDRKGEFEPQLIKKHQTRFSSVDEKIQYLYAKGLTTREIEDIFQELYGVEVSAGLISKVTNAVTEQIIEWQSRPLEAIYPRVYLSQRDSSGDLYDKRH